MLSSRRPKIVRGRVAGKRKATILHKDITLCNLNLWNSPSLDQVRWPHLSVPIPHTRSQGVSQHRYTPLQVTFFGLVLVPLRDLKHVPFPPAVCSPSFPVSLLPWITIQYYSNARSSRSHPPLHGINRLRLRSQSCSFCCLRALIHDDRGKFHLCNLR